MFSKNIKEHSQILWGRPGNNLRMGIVGLPNVGKSTTFNCLSKLSVPASNFPFCTVEPNIARVPIKDIRFSRLCKYFMPEKEIPAILEIMDIAGLVRGASEGKGLGNAFLSNINNVDGIFHCIRDFEDEKIVHTENTVDPLRDLEIISIELCLKDLQLVEKDLKQLKHGMNKLKLDDKREIELKIQVLEQAKQLLDNNRWIRSYDDWTPHQIAILNQYLLLTSKPVVYLINQSYNNFKSKTLPNNLDKILNWINSNMKGPVICYSAAYEQDLIDNYLLDNDFKHDETLEQNKTEQQLQTLMINEEESAIPKIIQTGFSLLDLIYYFTVGKKEVKCWTIRSDSTAPEAAGKIHSDFQKGFICADVMSYTDFVQYGGENECKTNGKLQQQGKNYIVKDGDIIEFKFNVSKQSK